MCYAGGVGFGGYGGYGDYIRRVRLFEIDTNKADIKTWKRVEYGENVDKPVDPQMIVKDGRVVPPPKPPPQETPPPAAAEKPAGD